MWKSFAKYNKKTPKVSVSKWDYYGNIRSVSDIEKFLRTLDPERQEWKIEGNFVEGRAYFRKRKISRNERVNRYGYYY